MSELTASSSSRRKLRSYLEDKIPNASSTSTSISSSSIIKRDQRPPPPSTVVPISFEQAFDTLQQSYDNKIELLCKNAIVSKLVGMQKELNDCFDFILSLQQDIVLSQPNNNKSQLAVALLDEDDQQFLDSLELKANSEVEQSLGLAPTNNKLVKLFYAQTAMVNKWNDFIYARTQQVNLLSQSLNFSDEAKKYFQDKNDILTQIVSLHKAKQTYLKIAIIQYNINHPLFIQAKNELRLEASKHISKR